VTIAVTDNGPGIAEDAQALIFEPFVHLEAVVNKHIPGVGLGLALVRDMVRVLGGQLNLESRVGSGSTFRVTLPKHA
jgi:signal transduction histidine kinase